MQQFVWLLIALRSCLANAVARETRQSDPLIALNKYDPIPGRCPSSALVRPANGISSPEASYVNQRKSAATASLKSFLAKSQAVFPSLSDDAYPTMALASSGGGLRALLSGAGVIKCSPPNDSKRVALADSLSL